MRCMIMSRRAHLSKAGLCDCLRECGSVALAFSDGQRICGASRSASQKRQQSTRMQAPAARARVPSNAQHLNQAQCCRRCRLHSRGPHRTVPLRRRHSRWRPGRQPGIGPGRLAPHTRSCRSGLGRRHLRRRWPALGRHLQGNNQSTEQHNVSSLRANAAHQAGSQPLWNAFQHATPCSVWGSPSEAASAMA